MATIVLTVSDSTLDRARRLAAHRKTDVESMVSELVERVVAKETSSNDDPVSLLRASFQTLSRPMNGVDWRNRDELYE